MRKFGVITLSMILAASLFVGCGKDNSKKETKTDESSNVSSTEETKADSSENAIETIEVEKVEVSDSESKIFVEKVENLSDDFLLGCDISSLIAEEQSGVKYYDENGNEEDLLKILAQHGVNSIRIRVWNDPYDKDGNGYGGGNNDTAKAIEIGKRATKYGMGVLIDYHYSDFWADPAKQMVPKAWKDMNSDEKQVASYDFTKDSLSQIIKAGVNVKMVQVGNETTTGLSGEDKWMDRAKVMAGGAKAIRELAQEYGMDILIATHFTNPENSSQLKSFAHNLQLYDVDYDVFSTSYYTVWHGSLENLTNTLSEIAKKYDKKVMVAETSYAYTYEDGDFFSNSISEGTACEFKYTVSVQGQANCIRDITDAVVKCGDAGIGVFYWEPAWIPVPGNSYDEQKELWEKYGSGWASSYSTEYDPEDAGKWYGGSSWDNQAMFDFKGNPLPSLDVFRLMKDGATTELAVDEIKAPSVTVLQNEKIELPTTVTALMNDRSELTLDVKWEDKTLSSEEIQKIELKGTVDYNGATYETKCTLNIVEPNYLLNSSFEEVDDDNNPLNWTITKNSTDEAYVIEKVSDAYVDTHSFHFYSSGQVDCSVEQTVTGLKPGKYKLSVYIQGGDAGDADKQDIKLYCNADGKEYSANGSVTKWVEWSQIVIEDIDIVSGDATVGLSVKTMAGSWGTADYFVLTPEV